MPGLTTHRKRAAWLKRVEQQVPEEGTSGAPVAAVMELTQAYLTDKRLAADDIDGRAHAIEKLVGFCRHVAPSTGALMREVAILTCSLEAPKHPLRTAPRRFSEAVNWDDMARAREALDDVVACDVLLTASVSPETLADALTLRRIVDARHAAQQGHPAAEDACRLLALFIVDVQGRANDHPSRTQLATLHRWLQRWLPDGGRVGATPSIEEYVDRIRVEEPIIAWGRRASADSPITDTVQQELRFLYARQKDINAFSALLRTHVVDPTQRRHAWLAGAEVILGPDNARSTHAVTWRPAKGPFACDVCAEILPADTRATFDSCTCESNICQTCAKMTLECVEANDLRDRCPTGCGAAITRQDLVRLSFSPDECDRRFQRSVQEQLNAVGDWHTCDTPDCVGGWRSAECFDVEFDCGVCGQSKVVDVTKPEESFPAYGRQ